MRRNRSEAMRHARFDLNRRSRLKVAAFRLTHLCRITSHHLRPTTLIMTTSKRLAEKKVAKFQKNITKRGTVPEASTKKGSDYSVGPIVIGFFVFVVIGSSLFQIIRTATSGGMA
uniref:Uncharacterized protein n=1 Tax=Kalanchoe fedtschenkoi TaxID=63787 RepID=A0A7N0UR26_KALFE